MDYKTILSRITEISKYTEKLECQLRAINSLDIGRFPQIYEDMLVKGSQLSEKITCKLRNLIYASTEVPKQAYLEKAAEVFEVDIQYDGEVFSIVLPCILPRKPGQFTSLFLMEPVNTALEQYASAHLLPKFRECCICIVHEYTQNPSGTRVFDYDNLEQKQLLDTIAMYILTDDNAALCDVFHTAQIGEKDCTRVLIMPKTSFLKWSVRHDSDKLPLSDFSPNEVR